ncbi:uracil-DNA glycosylase, partial [Mesorhizobium sp. M4B.F.Ca.ET.017.02.2.1]
MIAASPNTPAEIAELLAFYASAGVDEALVEAPINRFAEVRPKQAERASAPAARESTAQERPASEPGPDANRAPQRPAAAPGLDASKVPDAPARTAPATAA